MIFFHFVRGFFFSFPSFVLFSFCSLSVAPIFLHLLLLHPLLRASQSQCGRVLFGLESQVGDARVLARVLGGGGGGGDRRGGRGLGCERRQRQPEGRRGKHHVGRVRGQVRVQVVLRVGHGAVQLKLRLHLKGEGRHVAVTILRDGTHGYGGGAGYMGWGETRGREENMR